MTYRIMFFILISYLHPRVEAQMTYNTISSDFNNAYNCALVQYCNFLNIPDSISYTIYIQKGDPILFTLPQQINNCKFKYVNEYDIKNHFKRKEEFQIVTIKSISLDEGLFYIQLTMNNAYHNRNNFIYEIQGCIRVYFEFDCDRNQLIYKSYIAGGI